MTSATRQYRRRLSTQTTTLHNEQLEPRQLMAAVADGHTECQSEHTSDMSVQSFTEVASKVFGDSGASGLGGKEQSAKPGVNIGKIPLDEMMDHLGDRGIRPDFSELVKGVQNLLGRPGARAGFPGIDQSGELNPNDILGGNRDKIRDLLDSRGSNGLFRPGERTYQGDSQRDWSAAGSMIPGASTAARRLQSQASVGCGFGAGLVVVGQTLQKIPHPYARVAGAGLTGAGAGILLGCDFVDDQDQSDSTDDSTPASSEDDSTPASTETSSNSRESSSSDPAPESTESSQPVLVSEELDENGNVVHMTFAFPEEPSGTGGDDGQPNEENGWGGVPDVVMGDGKLEFRKPSEGVYDLTKAEMLSRLKPRERAFSIDAVINPVPDEVGAASNVSHQISEQAGFTPPIPTDGTWNTFGAGSAVSERAGYTPPIPVWSAFGTDKA
ncbi:MAG: hypothetical protein ISQ10_02955 [Planctomycetes bacterium]|nr:hypothetical protein [Planctomycetota bacterium]MBL6909242.1 hypothetical protein [Pirellulales bacterium]MBL7181707.1 hypothetical protein [Pirellulales bacterium]